jgi:hypothetical protein
MAALLKLRYSGRFVFCSPRTRMPCRTCWMAALLKHRYSGRLLFVVRGPLVCPVRPVVQGPGRATGQLEDVPDRPAGGRWRVRKAPCLLGRVAPSGRPAGSNKDRTERSVPARHAPTDVPVGRCRYFIKKGCFCHYWQKALYVNIWALAIFYRSK